MRFWKAPNDTGVHVGRIWSASGQLLASVTFSGESAAGWQEQALPAPLPITPNVVYTVSVNTTNRRYVASYDTFTSGLVNGNLHAPAGANGVFAQGAPGTFPTASYRSSNYFRDVVFIVQ